MLSVTGYRLEYIHYSFHTHITHLPSLLCKLPGISRKLLCLQRDGGMGRVRRGHMIHIYILYVNTNIYVYITSSKLFYIHYKYVHTTSTYNIYKHYAH